MKLTDGFALQNIDNIPYLLPYGQRIAEQRRGMRLNESGVFLWNSLPGAANRDELLTVFANHYEASPEELPELKQDMDAFLDELCAWGMLEEEKAPSGVCHTLYMGGISVHLFAPPQLELPQFAPFAADTQPRPDMTIEIIPETGPGSSSVCGTLLVCTNELCVIELKTEYIIRLPLASQITECRILKDGTIAKLYVTPPYREPFLSDLFHAIRFAFLFRAQQLGRIAIHSASVSYRGQAWLFAGSSGTGKSTHADLWKQHFHTPVINGDLNLISFSEGVPMVYGIPWCGTSGIYHTGAMPLGGVIHLAQSSSNICRTLSKEEQIRRLLYRIISPSWTRRQMERNLKIAETVAGRIMNVQLLCTKTPEAAQCMKRNIDTFLCTARAAGKPNTAQTEEGL